MKKDPDQNSDDSAEIKALITWLERGQLHDGDAQLLARLPQARENSASGVEIHLRSNSNELQISKCKKKSQRKNGYIARPRCIARSKRSANGCAAVLQLVFEDG
jgi:hypothetical protein